MITKITGRTNDQMHKVRKKINSNLKTNFYFAAVIQTKKKLNVYLDYFILELCTTIPNSQQKSSRLTRFLQGKYTGHQCH